MPAAEGAAKSRYAIAKSKFRWRTLAAMANTAIAQAFRKKKQITASSRAVKVDFKIVYKAEGRGSGAVADEIRISFTRMEVIAIL